MIKNKFNKYSIDTFADGPTLDEIIKLKDFINGLVVISKCFGWKPKFLVSVQIIWRRIS